MTDPARVRCVILRQIFSWLIPCLLSSPFLGLILYAQPSERMHGSVHGHIYNDPRYGLSYMFPEQLETQNSLPNGIPVGTGEKQGVSEFLFSAMEKPNGQVRRGVMIITDPKGTFGVNDVPHYLRQLVLLSLGAKEPIEVSPTVIGNRGFFRADVGGDAQVHFYGAQLSTLCGDQFLTFVFSGQSPEKVEELVHSMDRLSLSCQAIKP